MKKIGGRWRKVKKSEEKGGERRREKEEKGTGKGRGKKGEGEGALSVGVLTSVEVHHNSPSLDLKLQ